MFDSPPASSTNSLGFPPDTSTSEQFIASPTTMRTCPLWDEVAPTPPHHSDKAPVLPLQSANHKNDLVTDSVGKEMNRHKDSLQQLETRRVQIKGVTGGRATGGGESPPDEEATGSIGEPSRSFNTKLKLVTSLFCRKLFRDLEVLYLEL